MRRPLCLLVTQAILFATPLAAQQSSSTVPAGADQSDNAAVLQKIRDLEDR